MLNCCLAAADICVLVSSPSTYRSVRQAPARSPTGRHGRVHYGVDLDAICKSTHRLGHQRRSQHSVDDLVIGFVDTELFKDDDRRACATRSGNASRQHHLASSLDYPSKWCLRWKFIIRWATKCAAGISTWCSSTSQCCARGPSQQDHRRDRQLSSQPWIAYVDARHRRRHHVEAQFAGQFGPAAPLPHADRAQRGQKPPGNYSPGAVADGCWPDGSLTRHEPIGAARTARSIWLAGRGSAP